MRCSKKCAENKCICFDEIMWLIIMKMRLERKKWIRVRPRRGHKYLNIKCFLHAHRIKLTVEN